ncbi:type II toxin-antitoxin system PemK/MazF family toxin [Nitratifractor sp.]
MTRGIPMPTEPREISQGEIWMVRFYPQRGSEISKLRPAVVVSHDVIGRLPLKTVVPLTDWKANYRDYPWMLKIIPSKSNGLGKPSAADCFQIKNFLDERFVERIGKIPLETLYEIHSTIAKTFNPIYTICF